MIHWPPNYPLSSDRHSSSSATSLKMHKISNRHEAGKLQRWEKLVDSESRKVSPDDCESELSLHRTLKHFECLAPSLNFVVLVMHKFSRAFVRHRTICTDILRWISGHRDTSPTRTSKSDGEGNRDGTAGALSVKHESEPGQRRRYFRG